MMMFLTSLLFLLCLKLSGCVSCFEQVTVQQRGNQSLSEQLQIIVPRANFTCNGRVTGITASMDSVSSGRTDPYLQVWHPATPGGDVFDKVDEVQLVESEVVEEVDNNNNTYWLVNITLNDDDRIEFEAGDVIGYYHPPDTRYRVWSIKTAGYRLYAYNVADASSRFNLSSQGITINGVQPLIQFTIDIQCDILSTPSNGGMSCSSGRVGVGYEGDTCSFTCNTGYGLAGSDNRTCQSNGSWGGIEPICKQECIADISINQTGDDLLGVDRQVIIPYVNCSNSDGRITHIIASLSLNNSGSEYPSFQVWRPMSGDPSVYERIGDEIVLEDSEVRAMDGYWLAEIVVSDNERIEFNSGDVIGYYHPSNVRYQVNAISGNGSSVHDCDGGNMTTVITSGDDVTTISVNTSSEDCITNPQQPLIQLLFEIQCENLPPPTNGRISCSSSRIGVGYEGDTCSFTCNTGYELIGSDTRTCQSDGSWSGEDTACRKGRASCFNSAAVQQLGFFSVPPGRQAMIPRANFTCNGRITVVTASVDRTTDDNPESDPFLEVWRPQTSDNTIFDKVGEVQLVDSDVVEEVDSNDNTFWLLTISLNGSNRIEFERRDVVGFYHPPDTRYVLWMTEATGYTAYGNFASVSSSTFSIANAQISAPDRQPIIEFIFDIQCDILSTPSSGGMSCSSGKVGVGYEGDTCSFTCNTGYELTGSDTRTCQSDGSWSGSEISCEESTSSNDSSTTTIVAAVVASLFVLVIVFIIVGIFVIIIRQRRKKATDNCTVKQPQAYDLSKPSIHNTAEDKIMPEVQHSFVPKKEDEDGVLSNLSISSDHEMPVEKSYEVRQSMSMPDDYCEPLFDDETEMEKGNYDYSVAHEDTKKSSQQNTNSGGYYESPQAFIQPATCLNVLLAQIKETVIMEISPASISTVKELGYGEFGVVTLATWLDDDTSKEVAVKTLNKQASEKDKIKFFQEAALMAQFIHDKVIRMYGMVTKDPAMIVLEYAKKGDLRAYLISLQPDLMEGEEVPDTVPPLLLKFSREVAAGMNYLATKGFVHRDLAARNILLTEQEVCKIADFGMSRDLDDDKYYITSGGKIPVKWTAPEALQYKKYSTFSDVWSFGCVLYEMWSLGCKPFEETPVKEILTVINSGYRLPPPSGCPKLMYKLMIRCWHPDPKSRPAFILITKYLNKPDEDLLQISDGDIQLYGGVAVSLGTTPSSPSASSPPQYINSLYHDLQTVYKQIAT